jgi:hypothetical protein
VGYLGRKTVWYDHVDVLSEVSDKYVHNIITHGSGKSLKRVDELMLSGGVNIWDEERPCSDIVKIVKGRHSDHTRTCDTMSRSFLLLAAIASMKPPPNVVELANYIYKTVAGITVISDSTEMQAVRTMIDWKACAVDDTDKKYKAQPLFQAYRRYLFDRLLTYLSCTKPTTADLIENPFPRNILTRGELRELAACEYPIGVDGGLQLMSVKTAPEYVQWIAKRQFYPSGLLLSQHAQHKAFRYAVRRVGTYLSIKLKLLTVAQGVIMLKKQLSKFDRGGVYVKSLTVGREVLWYFTETLYDVINVLERNLRVAVTTEGTLVVRILSRL